MPYRYVQSVIWKLMCGGTKFGVKKRLVSTKHHTNDNYRYVTYISSLRAHLYGQLKSPQLCILKDNFAESAVEVVNAIIEMFF